MPHALCHLTEFVHPTGASGSHERMVPGRPSCFNNRLLRYSEIAHPVGSSARHWRLPPTRPLGVRLAATEASWTGVIDSFTLFTGAAKEPRVVPAANGIYYAICPVGATCPYPGRAAQRLPSPASTCADPGVVEPSWRAAAGRELR